MKKTEITTTALKLGLMAALIVVALPELSFAQDGISQVMKDVQSNQMQNIPKMISAVAYVIGAVLVLSGALSLKKHSENPASEPMGKGIGRLLAGGAVMALPAITRVMQETTEITGGPATFENFQVNF